MRVLLVEDEAHLSRHLLGALGEAGYAVDCAADGERAEFLGQTEQYDAVVLDLGLPKVDGLTILRRWRDAGLAMPVLILTARGSWHEKVQGIDAGADDYLAKPFRLEELLARLRALIRRASGQVTTELRHGGLTLDPRAAKVTLNGETIKLTSHEFRVLSYLMHNRGRIVSQGELTEHIYAQKFDRDSNTVEVFIARLRRKLGGSFIETVRGFGYRVREGGVGVKSLRARVMLGAVLWTLGLLAAITILLTFSHRAYESVRVIHAHNHMSGIVAIIAMVVGLWVVRGGLAPFDAMRARLGDVQRGTARRLEGVYASEVQPLVDDLNALLGQREEAVTRANAKAGDLAHGLKTPLAVLSNEAERLAATGQGDLAETIAQQVGLMQRQVTYHLAQARAAASGAATPTRCAVQASVDGLIRTLVRLHAARGLTLEASIDPGHAIRGSREDLDEMLGNLLDNACKWARTRVAAASALTDGHVDITVDDDGPGLEPSRREAVLQRGVRADEAVPGSGLGLAIVRDIAELYGGSISLEDSPLGGLRARLRLPRA